MTEHELIQQLREGSEHAFTELVGRFQDRVYNTALGILQQPNDAEDIAQEVFIQVYRSIQDFKGASALSTWIYRITVTKSLDHIRGRKRKKRLGFITELFRDDNTPVVDKVDFCHPGVLLDRREDARYLFKLINKLPENQKTAFILNKLEDLSYLEIAQVLSTTESAVDSLLQRAKNNLKKMIGNQQKN